MKYFSKINLSNLRWELITVIFISFFFHLVGLWMLGNFNSFESGLKPGYTNSIDRKLFITMHFLESENSVFLSSSNPDHVASLTSDQNIDQTLEHLLESRLPGDGFQTTESYLPPGRLTRMPSPINEIDLNIAELDAEATEVVIELTVLVKADGTVADVSTFVEDDKARHFVDLIASRFLRARFSPGEIDGKAVNSEFKVIVVSEPVTTLAEHS